MYLLAKWNYAAIGEDHGIPSVSGAFLMDDVDQTGAPTVVGSLSPRLSGMGGLAGAGGPAVDGNERYSRKVFVGGLPPDIDEGMLN